MLVSELMQKRVMTCSRDHGLALAAQIMWENDCGCVPVVDEANVVVGMVTDRDICMAAYLNGRSLQEIEVREAMSMQVLSCRPEDWIADAESIMRREQVRRLPVTDGNSRLVGLLSLNDIAMEAERERESRLKKVTLEEVGLTLSAVSHPRTTLGVSPPP